MIGGMKKSPNALAVALGTAALVLMALTPLPLSAAAKFAKVKLGSQQTETGKLEAKSVFTPETPIIAAVAQLEGVAAGTKITGDMHYQTPEGWIKPLSTTEEAKQGGDLTMNFRFSKPTKGWPQGNYKIVISLSTGEQQEITFKVE
ncbi:MAG: hypothetical protein FJ128_08200 [Deltaproteobacteria bacterium]|nr:hypothetical protein [Deltaproteobacteria bacterium]